MAFSQTANAELYSFYSSNMLFKQKEEAVLAGKATKGSVVACTLYNSKNKKIAYSECKVGKNGIFEVGFMAPAGSYEEYTIIMTVNGKQFDKLTNVVFGELWLASGQSNMALELNVTAKWDEFVENGYGNKWVRAMIGNSFELEDGKVPDTVQEDNPRCYWVNGKESKIGLASGVGYYFAEQLQKEINMPVGILNISMGSTWIRSWLSRKAVESSPEALAILKKYNAYVPSSEYDTNNKDMLGTLGANYNVRIYPVRRFNLSGMIWYQGENDLMYGAEYGEYSVQLDLLQKCYTETFGYKDGLLPIVYSQFASSPYHTTSRELQDMNAELASFMDAHPESRAAISLYDVSLEYNEVTYVYHPWNKEPVGRRMASAALGLVYNKYSTYRVSTLNSYRIADNAIYMKFKNTGDGLKVKGDILYGFLICGVDGVYYKAQAKLVSENVVKVWNKDIPDPKAASYAFSQENSRSNLWSTRNGDYYMPVSPSITDRTVGTVYSSDYIFADCDQEMYWRNEGHVNAGFYNIWSTSGCSYILSPDSAYSGYNGLKVVANDKSFSLKHVLLTTDIGKDNVRFYETNSNWSKYGSLSFKVRNTGNSPIAFNGIKLKTDSFKWYEPAFRGDYIIPADGQWHTITVEINNLSLFSFGFGASKALNDVKELDVNFVGKVGSTVDVDAFEFSPLSNSKMNLFEKLRYNMSNIQKKKAAVSEIG